MEREDEFHAQCKAWQADAMKYRKVMNQLLKNQMAISISIDLSKVDNETRLTLNALIDSNDELFEELKQD